MTTCNSKNCTRSVFLEGSYHRIYKAFCELHCSFILYLNNLCGLYNHSWSKLAREYGFVDDSRIRISVKCIQKTHDSGYCSDNDGFDEPEESIVKKKFPLFDCEDIVSIYKPSSFIPSGSGYCKDEDGDSCGKYYSDFTYEITAS
jgi:hypothetical protein